MLRCGSIASEGELGPALGAPPRAPDETSLFGRRDAVELEPARPSAAVLGFSRNRLGAPPEATLREREASHAGAEIDQILVSGAPAHHIFRRLMMPAAPRRGATLSAGRDGIAASWLRAVARLVFRLRVIFRPLGYAEAPGPTGASAGPLA